MKCTAWVINRHGHYFRVEYTFGEIDFLELTTRCGCRAFDSEDKFWSVLTELSGYEHDEVYGNEITIAKDEPRGWYEVCDRGFKTYLDEYVGLPSDASIENLIGEYRL